MTTDLSTLLAFQCDHSVWALRELLRCARTLSPSDVERDMGIGPGGVRENLAHTVEAMFFFADNFAGREYVERPGYAEGSKTLDGIAGLLEEAARELKAAMLAQGLGERVMWPNAEGGTMPAAAAVAQVFDHSTLHRAQCINMLKRLGVRPVPDLDPMSFVATGLWRGG